MFLDKNDRGSRRAGHYTPALVTGDDCCYIIYLDNNNPVDHHAQEVMMSSTLRATLLFFLVSTNPAAAFNNHRIINTASHSKNNNNSSYKSSELNLYNSVEEAIGEAQRICSEQGGDSEACRVAWDIVEELEAADAHRTPAHPTTQQELSYGPLILSLDLLQAKIDRKMDELNKLSQSLVEAGAGPEVERLAYASEEMKGILEEAVRSLDMYR